MSVLVGDRWTHAARGSFVLVPGGTTHDFENRGSVRATVLNFSVPSRSSLTWRHRDCFREHRRQCERLTSACNVAPILNHDLAPPGDSLCAARDARRLPTHDGAGARRWFAPRTSSPTWSSTSRAGMEAGLEELSRDRCWCARRARVRPFRPRHAAPSLHAWWGPGGRGRCHRPRSIRVVRMLAGLRVSIAYAVRHPERVLASCCWADTRGARCAATHAGPGTRGAVMVELIGSAGPGQPAFRRCTLAFIPAAPRARALVQRLERCPPRPAAARTIEAFQQRM